MEGQYLILVMGMLLIIQRQQYGIKKTALWLQRQNHTPNSAVLILSGYEQVTVML